MAMPSPSQLQKPKSLLSLFFFLPISVLVLFLLLLFSNVLNFLYLANNPPLPQLTDPLREVIPAIPRPSTLSVRVDVKLPKPKFHQNLSLLQESSTGFPQSNSSSPPKVTKKWLRRIKFLLRFLHSNARSRWFSTRAAEFFSGQTPNSTCEVRFFMTWISSLEALGPRELFTMESLFKSHPHACLLIVSNSMDSPKGTRLLRPFLEKSFRVAAISPDFAYLFKNTPAERWFERLQKGSVNPGEVSIGQNLSNLLRLALLYKFGGIYIDTDLIILRSLSGLKNVIGAQAVDLVTGNWSRLNNAVMVFDKDHPLLYKFIQEFALTFDGNKWGYNGPYLVSRVVSRVSGRPGFDFTVLPPEAFYPVDWNRIGGLFRGPSDGRHSRWVSAKVRRIQHESFAVHLWNRQSRTVKVEEGSVIRRIMSNCCLFCNSSLSTL